MVKRGFTLPILLIVFLLIVFVMVYFRLLKPSLQKNVIDKTVTQLPLADNNSSTPTQKENVSRVSIVAQNLEVPWALTFLPDGGMLVTERKGRVRFISKSGELKAEPVVTISSVKQVVEGGLHGIALHPDFQNNRFVYLYYTYSGSEGNTLNRVVRYTYDGNTLTDEKVIVDAIPGNSNHDGGRIKFGPDKMLYITTGDAQNPSHAQDKNSLAGKILRVTDEGNPAPGNPFGNRIYSYGHRNPQGITWDKNGTLWETEHGPSGFETGNDEFNKIEIGKNYGWPEIRGKQTKSEMIAPIIESGRSDTWAPAGLAYINGKIYFAGLRGQALYEVADFSSAPRLVTQFKGEFGRLREVVAGPDGMLYITTSNRDGRGLPKSGDDKVFRVNPAKL